MSAADDKKGQLESGSNTGIYIWLLLLFIVIGGFNLFMGQRESQFNQSRLTKAGNLRVLSQQVAKNASEASRGNAEAFRQLTSSTKEFQAQFNHLDKGDDSKGLPPSNEVIRNKEVKDVGDLWTNMNREADVVSQGQDTVIGLYDIAGELSATIPQMQFLYQNVQDILLDSRATAEQVMFATRQTTYAERILRSFQKVLAGGDDAEIAAQNFGHDVDVFGEVLTGMLEGDAMMGIARVNNAEARQALEEIANQYVGVKQNVDFVIRSTEELFKVHEASDTIFTQASDMLSLTEKLQSAYEFHSEDLKQIGHPYYSAAAGAFILLFIILLYARQRTDDRSRTERARLTADQEKLQNERNQQAIIRLLDEMEGLADGDLTTNATVTEDFTGAIADAMNFTIDQLRSLVSTIKDSVVKLANATDATQNISMELAQASRNQAQEITGASAAINEMAVSIEQVSANASESATVAEKSVDIAKKGGEVVRNTIQGMDTIREQIQETSKRIKRLGESSQEIGDIVSLINDISDQTNILALNAAIQASMAGEAGRGFAVVADEVQRLAERSGNATKQIEALVKTIQTDTNEAVISMEASTAEVVHGARLAQDAGVALEEIERVSKSLADLIQNISNAARQQAASAGHVSNTMNVIQEITNQTSEGTQNTASSIGKLAELADELNNSIAGFKLPDEA
ncbi:methyl-accepting chemotaxis protein [Aliikangiella coralliicola]|uniref:Chemotaxis protein n=1 Tax=Aliikangiella coralliicola TaxID=2592383 RepID=A0A545UHX9_9GAMM|nr:chemotaxis protein [Aliikangiella coralliicola]